ncbi:AAA family ATPase [Maritalea sp.]|jgi:hypothetical protein|uniref:AAA family ATPase n=1 Tax=Maritalea sp. TaxID=2003361 RepID=UPI0039E6E2A9
MAPTLKLNRLVVTKSGQRAYDQKFHAGLNIIHGTNGSGKSSILDFIFFALGGNLTSWKEYAKLCDTVFAEIVASGTTLTLRRDVSDENNRPMLVYFGDFEEASSHAIDGWQRFAYSRSPNGKSFSQVLFAALGIPEIPGDEGANITMHQTLRLMYADQTTPFQRIFRSENFDPRDTREAVAELLGGIGNNQLYSKRLQLRELKSEEAEITSKLTQLLRATSSLGENFAGGIFESELETIATERRKLYAEIDEIYSSDRDSSSNAKDAEGKRRELHKALSKTRTQLITGEQKEKSLEFEIKDSSRFITHLKGLLADFDRAALTYISIGDVRFEYCPSCFSEIGAAEEEHCHLCGAEIPAEEKAAKVLALRLDIEGQIRESQRIQTDREAEIAELKTEMAIIKRSMTKQMRQFDEVSHASVDGSMALISEKSRQIGKFDSRIEELERYKDIRDQITKLSDAKASAQKKISKLNDKIVALEVAKSKRQKFVKTNIANMTKKLLEKDLQEHKDFKHLDKFDYSFEDDWFAINGDPNITTSASGMVVVKNSLFVGMLLASLHDPSMMYPRFLLLDNVEDKGMVGERVRNFQAIIAELLSHEEGEQQVILTTSTLNPELNTPKYIVGRYYTATQGTLDILPRKA